MNYLEDISLKKLITLIKTEIKNKVFGTSNYGNGTVTRAKLAQDALYSPVSASSTKNLTVSDLGKSLYNPYNTAATYTLTQANSQAIPQGGEIAILRWGTLDIEVLLVADGVRFAVTGSTTISKVVNNRLKIAEPFGMIALKKFSSDPTNGDAWLVTGNVEVVE